MGLTSQDHEYQKTVTDPTMVRTTVEVARNEYPPQVRDGRIVQ